MDKSLILKLFMVVMILGMIPIVQGAYSSAS